MSDDKGLTRDEARRRAVEAAESEFPFSIRCEDLFDSVLENAIVAYERAMADAGWRMARDVGVQGLGDRYRAGWNACRRAMLGDE